MININILIRSCDFANEYHCTKLADLINHYMTDEMGVGRELTMREQLYMVDGLANHPSAFIRFAYYNDEIVGLIIGFNNFATFSAKYFLNIHDIIVYKQHRGLGIGKQLMEYAIDYAKENKFCKVTLEVREDNVYAQKLYKSLGFDNCNPKMFYWENKIL